jgi:hypothetical protein
LTRDAGSKIRKKPGPGEDHGWIVEGRGFLRGSGARLREGRWNRTEAGISSLQPSRGADRFAADSKKGQTMNPMCKLQNLAAGIFGLLLLTEGARAQFMDMSWAFQSQLNNWNQGMLAAQQAA